MDNNLSQKLSSLRGELTGEDDLKMLSAALPGIPQWLLDLMAEYPLANSNLTLEESADESGLGVVMRWLLASDVIDEAQNAYPGIAASRNGYFPVGECLLGTGDPYFIRSGSGESGLYRIPHTAVDENGILVEDRIERVSPSVEAFLRNADEQ